MLLGEGPTGMGFEILLKFERFVFVRKSAVPDELPRLEFSRVG
jgi:hypothetical protein